MAPVFLQVEHVLLIHARSIEEHGGSLGLRDPMLLSSAVAMPQATFGGQFLHPDLPAMAAAYLFHLCKNHPFVDGNKRVALATADIFVRYNNHRIQADNDRLVAVTLGVADGSISKEALIELFRQIVRSQPPAHKKNTPKGRKHPRRKPR